MMDQLPPNVTWPVRTIRLRNGDLYVSVDTLMTLRNIIGEAEWPEPCTYLLDNIIREARRADTYGRDPQ